MVRRAAHQRQHRLHRAGIGVPEVGVDQSRVTAFEFAGLRPIAAERGVDHAPHLVGNLVGGHADQSLRAHANRGQRQVVVAAEDLEVAGQQVN